MGGPPWKRCPITRLFDKSRDMPDFPVKRLGGAAMHILAAAFERAFFDAMRGDLTGAIVYGVVMGTSIAAFALSRRSRG